MKLSHDISALKMPGILKNPTCFFLIAIAAICGDFGLNAGNLEVEGFSAGDEPESIGIPDTEFTITTPWGYHRAENANREYAIVVNGCWGEGWAFTETVRKQYPAFFLEYQRCDSEQDGVYLAELLDLVKHELNLRIDLNRVYLTGFSKGGSGSYKVARGFKSAGKFFAAINRVAGQSQTELPDEIVENTAIWYHVGTEDTPQRVEIAQQAYEFLKQRPCNAGAVECIMEDVVGEFPRVTYTLTRDGVEVVKYSVYEGMGHKPHAVYQDSQVFAWLFSQSLKVRL